MSWWPSTLLLFLYSLSFPLQTSAQYFQDYHWGLFTTPAVPGTTVLWPWWQTDLNSLFYRGVVLDPEAVVLEYNCYYMREICRNAQNFLTSPRGLSRNFPNIFGFDMNIARKDRRNAQSCPGNWANFHPCPEPNQRRPMRHNGEWPHTGLEPLLQPPFLVPGITNPIEARRDGQGNVIEWSDIRWSCDEFPPATWIEGGSSVTPVGLVQNHGNALTRCAAIRCQNANNVKAEQNWQGTAHRNLRLELNRLITARQQLGEFPWYQGNQVGAAADGFAMFTFRTTNTPNGVAARILSYADTALTIQTNFRDITQAKRSSDPRRYLQWLNDVSVEELLASNFTKALHVYTNDTSPHGMSDMHVPNSFKFGAGDDVSFGVVNGTDLWDENEDDEAVRFDTRNSHNSYLSHDNNKEQHVPIDPARARGKFYGRNVKDQKTTPLAKRQNSTDLASARSIVEEALKKSAELNAQRYAHPLRNVYKLAPGTITGQPKSNLSTKALYPRALNTTSPRMLNTTSSPAPQLLEITDEIAAAAALVAEMHAANMNRNVSQNATRQAPGAAGSYWMEGIARKGTVPWGNDGGYKVFRNVRDYGAVGDGVTDDTAAIKRAMIDGNRCGEKCNGSTTKNAIVYFPPGTYLVSTTIPMPFGTQVIGDASNWPTIFASPSFVGLGVLSADEYTGGPKLPDGSDQEYYINTANFYRQVRNLRIDITATTNPEGIAGIHWQVGQATSLQNIEFIAASGTKQKGIFAENGSGGVMSDLTFRGGAFGIYGGQQQFTTQRMTFDGCDTGVQIIWDWSWTWKSITMKNVGVGFRLLPEAAGSGNIGSAAFMDCSFSNMETAVLINPINPEPATGSTGVVLENVAFSGVGQAVADSSGNSLLAPSAKVDFWAVGTTYTPSKGWSSGGRVGVYQRQQGLLDSQGNYFERAKPQYEDRGIGDFVHVKDFGARGDGVTDDTAAFQTALFASQGKILFVDAGSYIITGTVTIPAGSKLVGETWSQLVASGSYFSDASNPKVMLKVGNVGDVGTIEMQDLLFTTRGSTAGLIMVEWNIKASSLGSAALWDCHARVGGATGTELTPQECPPSTSGTNERCRAASLMMHITKQASGYFENMWLWVADHMIDDPDLDAADNEMVQTSVYVARGLLIESESPTWLYGTASEHAVMYQYNFNGAKNIFAGLIQTESAYYQPNPQPPAPFADVVGKLPGDPDYQCNADDEFSGCDESWAVIIQKSANIVVGGAGLYTWFSNYAQDCIDGQLCQKVLMLLKDNNAGVRFRNLVTIGAKYMAVEDGKGIQAIDNLNVEGHPRWSLISVIDFDGNGQAVDNAAWIDPKIWDMDQPQFSCSPPCVVKIPPWTKATSTVNYPILTVSEGAWTSTITRAPLTMGEVLFEEVTLTANAKAKLGRRQGFEPFFPKPASVPYYSPATYYGPNGAKSTITPTAKFPDQPASIGPNAPPPATGSWPQKAVQPIEAQLYDPVVGFCDYPDWNCTPDPWQYGPMGSPPTGDDGGDDGFGGSPSDRVSCPHPSKTKTTTTSKTTTSTSASTEPSPDLNSVTCYNNGRAADHKRIDNAIWSFCNALGGNGQVLTRHFYTAPYSFDISGVELPLKVVISAEIFGGNCSWKFTVLECQRYLRVPLDSCNCEGVDGKQGGVVSNNCLRFMVDPQTDT